MRCCDAQPLTGQSMRISAGARPVRPDSRPWALGAHLGARVRVVPLLAVVCSLAAGCPGQSVRPAENGTLGEAEGASPSTPTTQAPAPASEPAAKPGGEGTPTAAATGEATGAQGQSAPTSARQRLVERALAYDPADPLGDLASADVLSNDADQGDRPELSGPCQWASRPRRLWSRPGQFAIAACGSGFVVAGYASAKDATAKTEELVLLRLDGKGPPKLLHTSTVSPALPGERLAPPGLAARDAVHITLATTDGVGALKVAEVAVDRPRASVRLRAIAAAVDTRFAPAVTHVDAGALVAYTEGSTPMRTHVALVRPDGSPATTTNVTPAHVGAAAPAFADGASPPVLYLVDARDGMSPILASKVSAQGAVEQARVVVPVGMVAAPTRLAAGRAAFGTALAYVGMGSAATTAIGVVDVAPKPGSPTAMVPGTAYGPLSVSVAASFDALYFAVDTPTQPGDKAPKRAIEVVRVDGGGARGRSKITGSRGDAYGAAIARGPDGMFGLVYNQPDAAYFARLRCQ